jgi:hypothetical protein
MEPPSSREQYRAARPSGPRVLIVGDWIALSVTKVFSDSII